MSDIPEFEPVPNFSARSGMSRSQIYNLLKTGELHARKVGARTLIDVPFGLAWLRSRPLSHPAQAAAGTEDAA